jgi:deoxyribose-phosphate aldolase
MDYTCRDIAKMIDHSVIRPEQSERDIRQGCETAVKYDVATVSCAPCWVTLVAELLKSSDVKPQTIIGFPHGYHTTETKAFESERSINDGARELNMVINISKLLSRDFDYVRNDIRAVVDVARGRGVLVMVILENCYLTDDLKEIGCRLSEEAGADFVKTSTGFAPAGATIEDLRLMRRTLSSEVQVKAAGGVRDLDMALKVREAGATRFGATKTAEIMEECYRRKGKSR